MEENYMCNQKPEIMLAKAFENLMNVQPPKGWVKNDPTTHKLYVEQWLETSISKTQMPQKSSTVKVYNFNELIPGKELLKNINQDAGLSFSESSEESAMAMIEEMLGDSDKAEILESIKVRKNSENHEDAGATQNNVKDAGLLKGWIIKKKPRTKGTINDMTYFHIESDYLSFRSLTKVDDFVFHGIRPTLPKKSSAINPGEASPSSDAKESIESKKRSKRKSTNWTFTEQGNEISYKGENYKIYDITFPKSSPEGSMATKGKNKRGRKPLGQKVECNKEEAGKKGNEQAEETCNKDETEKKEPEQMPEIMGPNKEETEEMKDN